MTTETRRFDLRALGLDPVPRPVPLPSLAVAPLLVACDLAGAALDAGFVLARAWLCVGWVALDAAERWGRR